MKVPANFEEFKEMVRNRPVPDTPGYYRLSVCVYDPEHFYPENKTHTVRKDGHTPMMFQKNKLLGIDDVGHAYMIDVDSPPMGADFATFKEAKTRMLELVGGRNIFAFKIERLGFGQLAHNRFPVECWMFDAKGEFVQQSSCSSFHYREPGIYGKFFGHDKSGLPYKRGEIVMIPRCFGLYGSQLVLGVVAETPMTLEEEYDSFQTKLVQWVESGHSPESWVDNPDYPGSDDDEYFIQIGRYTAHMGNFHYIHLMDVYPAPKDLPDEILSDLKQWHECYSQFDW